MSLSQKDYIKLSITDATAIQSANPIIELGFIPTKWKIQNLSHADYPVLEGGNEEADVSATEEGIQISGTGTVARAVKTTDEGVKEYAGGDRISYNDATTPTYQDQDGTAVTAGSIFDISGSDVLAREMPALSEDNGKYYTTKPGIKLPTSTQNALIRGNAEVIVIEAWR